jgi:hypothetical protein
MEIEQNIPDEEYMTVEQAKAKGLIRYDVAGGERITRERAETYFTDPERLGVGTVIIPSAEDSHMRGASRQISGFDPDAPQPQLIDGERVWVPNKKVTESEELPEPKKKKTRAKKAAAKLQPEESPMPIRPQPTGDDVDEAVNELLLSGGTPAIPKSTPAPRKKISAAGPVNEAAAPTPQRQPVKVVKVQVKFGKVWLPLTFHDAVITPEGTLALIMDTTRVEEADLPEFEPTDDAADQPYTIKVGKYQLVCRYYGQTYQDSLKREHWVFVVDMENSRDLSKPTEQEQSNEPTDEDDFHALPR